MSESEERTRTAGTEVHSRQGGTPGKERRCQPEKRMPKVSPPTDSSEQDAWAEKSPTPGEVEARLRATFEAVIAFAKRPAPAGKTLYDFELALRPLVFVLGRLLLALFLCRQHEGLAVPQEAREAGRRFRRKQPQGRELGTFFGKVRYWRTYMHAPGGGFYPLDRLLKIPADGCSFGLVSLMTRLATKVSYAQARLLLQCCIGWSPSTTSVERAVLGLGRRTQAWFEAAPAPEGDGEVLVIMADCKASPTATEAELRKRRGKRRKKKRAASPRHRGRQRRKGRTKKPRRKKGDHSKNGRAATLLVMYTLKVGTHEGKRVLKGPINRRLYGSYGKQRHAFAIARREADRRGFTRESGKVVQIVMDGANSLSDYARELFPEAIFTLDVIHATEYVWKAGRSFFREGSKDLERWVASQRERLYDGDARGVVADLEKGLARIPKTGPGNKGKRERLEAAIRYLSKRVAMMNYKELIAQDLEISSGPIEGAVRYVIGQRFDSAGMRWIRERAEALLQLRCIELNGHWDEFLEFVEGTAAAATEPIRLQAASPAPLPTFGTEPLAQAS